MKLPLTINSGHQISLTLQSERHGFFFSFFLSTMAIEWTVGPGLLRIQGWWWENWLGTY
jgi:hypothetical protein